MAVEEFNFYSLSAAIERRDKKRAWVLMQRAFLSGISGEELFWRSIVWKVKDMLKSHSQKYKKEELINLSEKLVIIYHEARRGNLEFDLALEKIIITL